MTARELSPQVLFATYYLLQASRTGYHYRTVFVTRDEQVGREALDRAVDSHHHYRLVDAATTRVLAIRRPEESE